MVTKQKLSEWLANGLDEFGYSEKRVQERIWMNDKNSHAKTISTQEITADKQIEKFLVGSQREGIALWGESDSDWMQINLAVLCTDKLKNIKGDRHGRIVLRIEKKNAPSGYTYLLYNSHDNVGNAVTKSVKQALDERSNGVYLSSSRYMDSNEDVFCNSPGYIGRNTIYEERNGPSIPKQVKMGAFFEWYVRKFSIDINRNIDLVRGFECHCPALINSWVNRKRSYSWPTIETIRNIAELPIYVVPVGLSGSQDEDIQWRFSFTLAEITLVRSLNETQRKMLIVLRQIAKYQLQPKAPDMSSYIIKNVVFWIIERRDPSTVNNSQLIDLVLEALEFLLERVEKRVLNHYFIPERNLFQGKFQGKQRKLLMETLNDSKVNGIRMVTDVCTSSNIDIEFPDLGVILENRSLLNLCDKVDTLRSYPMSTTQLASYFTYSYYCNFWFMIMVYGNIWLFLVFGTKCLSDPLSIDIIKKAKDPQRYWYKPTVITTNKSNTKRLVKMERCSWLMSWACETSKKFEKYFFPSRSTSNFEFSVQCLHPLSTNVRSREHVK